MTAMVLLILNFLKGSNRQITNVPTHGLAEAALGRMAGLIAQSRTNLGDVRQRMPYIPLAEIAINRPLRHNIGISNGKLFLDDLEQFVESGPLTRGDIEDIACGFAGRSGRCKTQWARSVLGAPSSRAQTRSTGRLRRPPSTAPA